MAGERVTRKRYNIPEFHSDGRWMLDFLYGKVHVSPPPIAGRRKEEISIEHSFPPFRESLHIIILLSQKALTIFVTAAKVSYRDWMSPRRRVHEGMGKDAFSSSMTRRIK